MGRIADFLNRPICCGRTDRRTEAVLAIALGLALLGAGAVSIVSTWYFGGIGQEVWLQGCPLAGTGILIAGVGLTGLRRRKRGGGAALSRGGEKSGPPSEPAGVPVRPNGPKPKLEAAAARHIADEDDG